MRICSTCSTPLEKRPAYDYEEIRLDVFPGLPEGCGENTVATLAGKDASIIPKGFPGLVDIAESTTKVPFRFIRSIHDFQSTPDSASIVRMLSDGEQEISKGAFMASSFGDLHNIYLASKALGRKHVLLGMGETGRITRLRQKILNNEFTFGFLDGPTAPGQFSAEELAQLGDDCIVVGITGDPVTHSKSPVMQNAAIGAAGLNAVYLRFGSPDLAHMREVMCEYDVRGMNVTIPHKQDVISQMDSVSKVAETVGAVNTVINDGGWFSGENTDVAGILSTFSDTELDGKKVLIMGSGGAARAAGYAFTESGCDTYVTGRNRDTVRTLCRDLGTESIESPSAEGFDIIVNCTPIGMYTEGRYPADVTCLNGSQTVFDMVYGFRTPLISAAEDAGCIVKDGTDMLVGQGAASFKLWFGKDADTKVMRRALS